MKNPIKTIFVIAHVPANGEPTQFLLIEKNQKEHAFFTTDILQAQPFEHQIDAENMALSYLKKLDNDIADNLAIHQVEVTSTRCNWDARSAAPRDHIINWDHVDDDLICLYTSNAKYSAILSNNKNGAQQRIIPADSFKSFVKGNRLPKDSYVWRPGKEPKK